MLSRENHHSNPQRIRYARADIRVRICRGVFGFQSRALAAGMKPTPDAVSSVQFAGQGVMAGDDEKRAKGTEEEGEGGHARAPAAATFCLFTLPKM
jgi:hypothetical protein